MSEPISGGCLYGTVRWEASAVPRASVLCHCDTCRRATGSYHTDTDTDRTFCTTCGTPLTYHHHADRPDDMDVTTGSADDGDTFPPTRDVFVEEKLSWVATIDGTRTTGEDA